MWAGRRSLPGSTRIWPVRLYACPVRPYTARAPRFPHHDHRRAAPGAPPRTFLPASATPPPWPSAPALTTPSASAPTARGRRSGAGESAGPPCEPHRPVGAGHGSTAAVRDGPWLGLPVTAGEPAEPVCRGRPRESPRRPSAGGPSAGRRAHCAAVPHARRSARAAVSSRRRTANGTCTTRSTAPAAGVAVGPIPVVAPVPQSTAPAGTDQHREARHDGPGPSST